MIRFAKISFYILIFCSLIFSCEKEEEYSIIPAIKYNNFYLTPGETDMTIATGNLVFTFVDGDGDIGNFDEHVVDTTAEPLNMFISGSYKNGGDFTPYTSLSMNLPYFEKGIYRKSIKGEIEIEIYITILTPDTLQYSFYLVDRAGNQSNIETTPTLIISELLEQL